MASGVQVPQIYKALGQSIGSQRRRSGLTQQALADAIGISRASVANIERGEQRVFFDQIASIASFFSLRGIDDLLAPTKTDSELPTARVNLSGDRLSRDLKREVRSVVDELFAVDQ